jgi:hypothetical protein
MISCPRILAVVTLMLLLSVTPSAADETTGNPEKNPETPAENSAPPSPPPEPSPQPQPPPLSQSSPPAEQNLKPIEPNEATTILGKQVRGAAGEDMGRVVDVLVDADGKPRAAIIDFGGFLGVGSRKIAVEWPLLQFRPGDHDQTVLLGLTREQVQAAPEYKESKQRANKVVAPSSGAATPPDAGK